MTSSPIFSNHGCRLNAYETAAMKELAQAAGVSDAVIVNTCAVTSEAVRKARKDIRRLRRENPGAKVIVTGCAAQIDAAGFAAMSEVDRVIAENPAQVEKARVNPKLAGWFVGQVMKATGGKANPKAVNELVSKKLGS